MIFNKALIPQQQQVVPRGSGGGGAGQGFKSQIPGEDYFGIPNAPEGLQYTGQLAQSSANLFKKRQDLINYAKTQWTKNKIDVTNPDPYRPEAVMAAEVFKMEMGNFLSQADKAKQGQEIYKSMLNKSMDNTYQLGQGVNDTYASELDPLDQSQAGYSKNVDPLLQFSKDNINKTVETNADFNSRKADAQALQGAYANPQNPQEAIQLAAANSLGPARNIPAPSSDDSGKGLQIGSFVERFINHKAGGGNWAVSKTYTKGGEPWVESTDYQGTNLGKKSVKITDASGITRELDQDAIVDKTVRNPDTGETYFVFTNKNIPDERIDGTSSNQTLESMLKGKGVSSDKLYKYLTEKGVVDDAGNIVDDEIITPSSRKNKEAINTQAKSTQFNTDEVMGQVKESTDWHWYNPLSWGNKGETTMQSPTYGEIKFLNLGNGKIRVSTTKGKQEIPESSLPAYVRQLGLDTQVNAAPIQGTDFHYDGNDYTLDELKSVLSEDQIKKFIGTGLIKPK